MFESTTMSVLTATVVSPSRIVSILLPTTAVLLLCIIYMSAGETESAVITHMRIMHVRRWSRHIDSCMHIILHRYIHASLLLVGTAVH